MTTIAWDGHTLATDSQLSCGQTAFGTANKIFKLKDGRFMALAGRADVTGALLEWLDGGPRPELDEEDEDFIAIVVDAKGCAFEFDTKLRTLPAKAPWAGGSGVSFALAAMHLGHDAVAAVKVACKLDVYSGGRVQHVTIRQGGKA